MRLKEKVGLESGTKKRRPGVHAKSKTSKVKSSKHYIKKYKGQGR